MPKISILIINYNGGEMALECLRSLEKQTFKDFEIIVVDNASCDGSLHAITQYLGKSWIAPVTRIISAGKNLGFAGGNNEGMQYAQGAYIALLNNDTEVEADWLGCLVRELDAHAEAGICASKMVVFGTKTIDSAGDGYSTLLKGFKLGEELPANDSRFCRHMNVFGACAGAALYRRSMIDEIGFLDDDFFLIHEDTDLNFRAQLAGWKVLYVPDAIVYHKVRSSIIHMSNTAVYYTLRNSEFVRIKNVPIGVAVRCLPSFMIGMLSEFVYFVIKHKKAGLYFKAKKDALIQLPRMWRKRKIIMKNRKTTNKYIRSIMTSAFEGDFFKAKMAKLFHG